jgi:hypothetical protein
MGQARRRSTKVRKCAGAAIGGEEDEGMSQRCHCTTKPPTPRLAVVEATEQAQKLRVVGGRELAGVRKEASGEGRIEGWPVPERGESAVAAAARSMAEARGERRKGREGRKMTLKWADPPDCSLHAARRPPVAEGGVQDPSEWPPMVFSSLHHKNAGIRCAYASSSQARSSIAMEW